MSIATGMRRTLVSHGCGALGDADAAAFWLERACAERDPQLVWAEVDPRLAEVRQEPRIQTVIRKVGLQRSAAEPRSGAKSAIIRAAMDPEQVETFRASLSRCLAAPGFLDTFYKRFVASSEEVREKFENTDLGRQTRMLADSLFVLANAALSEEGSPGRGSLPHIAARHSRADLDIPAALYDHWLSCLLDTARLHDPEFAPEVEAAWRTTLGWGIEYMRSRS